MTDIATLSIAPPTAAPATPGTSTSPAAGSTAASADGAPDPFAALLASLAPATDPATATPDTTTPPIPVPAAIAGTPATKTPAPATPAAPETLPVLEQDGEETGDAPKDDGSDDAEGKDDPQLAMMLALAPPPPAVAVPVATAAPATATTATAAVDPTATGARAIGTAAKGMPADAATAEADSQPAADSSTQVRSTRFAGIAARLFAGVAPAATAEGNQTAAATDAAAKAGTTDTAKAAPSAADQQVLAAIRNAVSRDAQAPTHAASTASVAEATVATGDRSKDPLTATPDPAAALFSPSVQTTGATQDAGAAGPAAPATDAAVTRELSVAQDGQWLDTLARDIAATAGKDGSLSFRLDPHHLGSLTVHIAHSADGASIRLSADTEAGRAMLQDAQPRLAAEARAQGLTLRETSVDLGGSGAGSSGQQGGASSFSSLAQGQSQRDPSRDQTFVNLNPAEADETAPASQAGSRSDLYA